MRGLVLSVCILLSILIEGQAQYEFDCHRPPGPSCSGHGSCQDSGACICDPPFNGAGDFSCSLDITPPATLTVGTACANPCQNGGSCYTPDPASGLVERCLCLPAFGGSVCDKDRGSIVSCRTGDMIVEVYPQITGNPFTGSIAVQLPDSVNTLAISGCRAGLTTPGAWNSDEQRFRWTFFTTTDASNPCISALQEKTVDGNLQFCYDIRILYSSIPISTRFDETFSFCCTEQVNTNPIGVTVANTGIGGGEQVTGSTEIIKSVLALTSDVVNGNLVKPTTPVNLGTELTLVVDFINDDVRYLDLDVESCTASATGIPDFPLLIDGCPATDALSILRDVRKKIIAPDTKNKILVDTWAFKPTDAGTDITIMCTVTVCTSTCPARVPAQCLGTSIQNLGRRRRAADDSTNTIKTFNTTASYTIYVEVPQANSQTCETCEECGLMKEVFLPVAVVFGLVLLGIFILAVFLCFRYRKGQHNKESA